MCVVGDVRAMLLTILWLFFDIIDIFDVYWNVCTNLSSEITKHTLFIIILTKLDRNWTKLDQIGGDAFFQFIFLLTPLCSYSFLLFSKPVS